MKAPGVKFEPKLSTFRSNFLVATFSLEYHVYNVLTAMHTSS